MDSEARAVATAHLVEPAAVAAIGTTRRWVMAFAEEHGMAVARRHEVALALSEAVGNAVRHAYPAHDVGDVLVDVATDGEWLTVRVADQGAGAASPDPTLGLGVQLMTRLAHRLELASAAGSGGTVVLMEFPMGAPAVLASVRT